MYGCFFVCSSTTCFCHTLITLLEPSSPRCASGFYIVCFEFVCLLSFSFVVLLWFLDLRLYSDLNLASPAVPTVSGRGFIVQSQGRGNTCITFVLCFLLFLFQLLLLLCRLYVSIQLIACWSSSSPSFLSTRCVSIIAGKLALLCCCVFLHFRRFRPQWCLGYYFIQYFSCCLCVYVYVCGGI